MDWLDSAVAAVAESQPMASGPALHPVVQGRVLIVDGDYLAYYCAGNDETEPGMARRRAYERLELMRDACGAERIVVHLTAEASTKGDRFIIAVTKPYQGHRKGDRRPKNWQYLRDWMEGYDGPLFSTKTWGTREADDGMAYHASTLGVDKAVIATGDKDLRMVPAWHLDWRGWDLTRLGDEFRVVGTNGLLYGTSWLWQQTLQGDTADGIPGLPKYVVDGKAKLCGEKTAEKFLAACQCDNDALRVVSALYASFYKEEWPDRLAEQLGLLWMRRDREAAVDDFAVWLFPEHNNPLHIEMAAAANRLADRVRAAKDEVAQLCGN